MGAGSPDRCTRFHQNPFRVHSYESEEERLKKFVLPEGEQERLKEDLRATAEERIQKMMDSEVSKKKGSRRNAAGSAEEEKDFLSPEGFLSIKEQVKRESEDMLNKAFDEAKANIRSEFDSKLEELDEQRRLQKEENEKAIEEQRKQDEAELERVYQETIVPLKKERDEMQKIVDSMKEDSESPARNSGLFFQKLYGPPSVPRKEKALRPQSAESGKIKFIEENASDAKMMGKATKDAIEDLQAQAEEQAEPFKRAAYSVIGAIILLNAAKWIGAHNPFAN